MQKDDNIMFVSKMIYKKTVSKENEVMRVTINVTVFPFVCYFNLIHVSTTMTKFSSLNLGMDPHSACG